MTARACILLALALFVAPGVTPAEAGERGHRWYERGYGPEAGCKRLDTDKDDSADYRCVVRPKRGREFSCTVEVYDKQRLGRCGIKDYKNWSARCRAYESLLRSKIQDLPDSCEAGKNPQSTPGLQPESFLYEYKRHFCWYDDQQHWLCEPKQKGVRIPIRPLPGDLNYVLRYYLYSGNPGHACYYDNLNRWRCFEHRW